MVIFGLAVCWIIGNSVARVLGTTALEELPFPDLGFVATIAALLVALLILTTQRHDEQLAENRAQLTLQIAMLSERKIAEVVELLEEQRRDNPLLRSRADHEAAEMARPSDHDATLRKIRGHGRAAPREGMTRGRGAQGVEVRERGTAGHGRPNSWRASKPDFRYCPGMTLYALDHFEVARTRWF